MCNPSRRTGKHGFTPGAAQPFPLTPTAVNVLQDFWKQVGYELSVTKLTNSGSAARVRIVGRISEAVTSPCLDTHSEDVTGCLLPMANQIWSCTASPGCAVRGGGKDIYHLKDKGALRNWPTPPQSPFFPHVSEPSLIFHRLVMDSFYLFTSEVLLCEKDSLYNITYSWLGIDGIRNLLLMCHCGKLTRVHRRTLNSVWSADAGKFGIRSF